MKLKWYGKPIKLMLVCAVAVFLFMYYLDNLLDALEGELDVPELIANVPMEIKDEMMKMNEEKVASDDPRLVKLIKDYFIHQPSAEPYNLTEPDRIDYAGQGKDFVVPNALEKGPEKGFFIECGANNGEYLSSTLFFEKEKHWTGLLIEADLRHFRLLLTKHRKAYAINACLSTKPYPSVMIFNQLEDISRLIEGTFRRSYKYHKQYDLQRNLVRLQCFPLYSILLAIDRLQVDFFGLDVEGTELDILQTIPLDKVSISNILAEYSHSDGGLPALKTFFERTGYTVSQVLNEDILVQRRT